MAIKLGDFVYGTPVDGSEPKQGVFTRDIGDGRIIVHSTDASRNICRGPDGVHVVDESFFTTETRAAIERIRADLNERLKYPI